MIEKTLQHWVVGLEIDDIIISSTNERFMAGSKRYHEVSGSKLKGRATTYREPTSGRLILQVYGLF